MYRSVCCDAFSCYYPESDLCPDCGEHTEFYDDEDLEDMDADRKLDEQKDRDLGILK